ANGRSGRPARFSATRLPRNAAQSSSRSSAKSSQNSSSGAVTTKKGKSRCRSGGGAAAGVAGSSAASKSSRSENDDGTRGAGERCKKRKSPRKVPGIFGIPVAWNVEDCDYEDSEDESYTQQSEGSGPPTDGATASAAKYGQIFIGFRRELGLRLTAMKRIDALQQFLRSLLWMLSIQHVLWADLKHLLAPVHGCATVDLNKLASKYLPGVVATAMM
ncbi:unnamed protein product, partial [Ectocarpus sp. 6 AP-2014]